MLLEVAGASQSPTQLRGLIKLNVMGGYKNRHSNAIQRKVSESHRILNLRQLDRFIRKQQTL